MEILLKGITAELCSGELICHPRKTGLEATSR